MSPFLKTLMLAAALVGFAVVPAYAEPGEGGQDEISAKIQKQMDKIIELMERNEKALLALSTGNKAKPEAVDVVPPALPPQGGEGTPSNGQPGEGQGGNQGGAGEGRESAGRAGAEGAKAIDELIKSQRKSGGTIPGELEELVRMVPQ